MPTVSFPEGVDSPLGRVDSSLTLTNTSTYPSPRSSVPSSRTASVDRQKRAIMGHVDGPFRQNGVIHRYSYHELDATYMSFVIIVCFFISGLVDSVAFNSWNCFVNMQTGNTVFAALGLGGQPKASHKQQYYKSLTAIGSFCLGTLFFSALHRFPTGLSEQPTSRRRFIFLVSFAIQTVLIAVPALLVTLDLVSNKPFVPGSFSSGSNDANDADTLTNFLDLCPVALLSFQAAGQTTLSRLLAVLDMPTIVLSALYFDFTGDLYSLRSSWTKSTSLWEFLNVHQKRQGQRFLCIVALFVGGLTGGLMYKSQVGMAGALWSAAGLKMLIVVAWMIWPAKKDERTLPR
ncbi:hypothetical protein PV08_11583 [Exophiala spinifera]|uniref:DUF1275 domain protein n=1 Tax=Exophiala spinifera TaxID=91928 RepID=A0A0D2BH04_9EURO|nr:uncharacterized protein PV08_11583 [Exophiala spinifera]KIW10619.1 hypothetical protein PV08_11583 [Exophiala spinifera]